MSEAGAEQQLKALANMLLLQQRLREAQNIPELGFILANDTQSLVKYIGAVVWSIRSETSSGGSIVSVSGAVAHDPHSPYLQWMKAVCKFVGESAGSSAKEIVKRDLPENLAPGWDKHGSACLQWCPLVSGAGVLLGGMLLWRDKPLVESEQRIIANWLGAAGYSLGALAGKTFSRTPFVWTMLRKRIVAGAAAALFFLMFLPVRLSVLAPAEIIARDPLIVKAPLDGIIADLHVRPNMVVEAGTRLVSLDDTELQTRLDVAEQAFAISRAQYQQAGQSASRDMNAKASLRVLALESEKRKAEVVYVSSLLDRSSVEAAKPGVVMMPSPDELIGKPVVTGERLMTIADPENTQLEAWLAVGDDISLTDDALVEFFPNVAPDKKFLVKLSRMDYRAEVTETGDLAFRVRGEFEDSDSLPRIGMRGTAKIYGEDVVLAYYLFRKPMVTVRRWLGV